MARLTRRGVLALSALPASASFARAEWPDEADVVVYGGVPCGIAAAVTAAEAGDRVVLVEPTRHVGGLSTSGINTAESEHMLKWTIGGFADRFYRRLGAHYGTGRPEYFFESGVAEKVYLDLLREAGVSLFYGAGVERVDKTGARLDRLRLTDGREIRAAVFVDASYEGDLMARAGVGFTFGRESRVEYGEEAAGIRFDRQARKAATVDAAGNLLPGISGWAKDYAEGDAHPGVMNYNFRITVTTKEENRAPLPEPERYDRGRYRLLELWLAGKRVRREPVVMRDFLGVYARRNGKFELNNQQDAIISLGNFGGQFGWPDGTYADRVAMLADHREYALGLLHFLRTEPVVPDPIRAQAGAWGLPRDEFPDNGHFPYQLYVREARRMKGAGVVTQMDVARDRRKEDAIGISSHFIDAHHVQRLAVSATEFVNEGRIWRVGWAYQIPYKALTPKPTEARNLLVPGAASYSHVAYCTLRLESVWMIVGQAAGVAAAEAVRTGLSVQEIDVARVQHILRDQRQVVDFIPGAPERFEGGAGGFAEF